MTADTSQTPLPLDAWLARVGALTVHELSVSVLPARDARFEEPINVVARGLLGGAFRTRRCLTSAPVCAGCSEAPVCDFDRVFERDEGMGHRAFWLRGLPAHTQLRASDRLRVTLALLDRERAVIPDFAAALRASLESLGASAGARNEVGIPSRVIAPMMQARPDDGLAGAVRVELRSPVLLRGAERDAETLCPDAPGFGKLLRAGVRRLASLARVADASQRLPAVAWPDLRGLRLLEDRVTPWQAARFSRAQSRRQPLEGLEGHAVLEGPGVIEVLPLLRAMERVGVGRKTSFGFGEIHAEAMR